MTDPSRGCGEFDDRHPVRVLSVDLHIENESTEDMVDWYTYFANPNGDWHYVCYHAYDQGGLFPTVPAGKARDVAFKVFFELGDSVAYGIVLDKVVGSSERLSFP